jgi:hypothetical protein
VGIPESLGLVIKLFSGDCPIETIDGSPEIIGLIKVQSEICFDKVFGSVVNFQEVEGLLSQLRASLCENGKLLKVVIGKLHLTSLLSLVKALRQDVAGIPLDELVELDGSQVVPHEECPDARNFNTAGSGLNRICSYIMCLLAQVLQDAVQGQLNAILRHISVGRHFCEVDLGHWHFSVRTVHRVWSQPCAELLMVEDSRLDVLALHEVFGDDEDWVTRS